GWVVCGLVKADAPGDPGGSKVSVSRLMWFPTGRDPVDLKVDGHSPTCMSNSMRVVDSADGPMVIFVDQAITANGLKLSGLVLATGKTRHLLDVGSGDVMPDAWAATSSRVIVQSDGAGLQLFDLATGHELPLPTLDLGTPSELELSPDGKTLAALVGEPDGPLELTVYDLTTG